MADYDKQFTPEEINEQIRHFSSAAQGGADPNQRLIQDLRRVCSDNEAAGEDARSLQRSWERIALTQHYPGQAVQTTSKDRKVISMNTFTKEAGKASFRHTFGRRSGVLAAAIIALFLVGSMVFAFSMMHTYKTAHTQTQSTLTGAGSNSSNTQGSTASKVKQGQTLEVFRQPDSGVYGVDWSADGKRIVSSGHSVSSWDALTGKHSIDYPTLPVPLEFSKSTSDTSGYAPAVWSPDGKSFALPYYSDIQIWDGTTKQLIKTFHYTLPISHTIYIYSVHWSTDGKSVSALVPASNNINNTVYTLVTFDLATGAKQPDVSLSINGILIQAAWSPDDNYLATVPLDSPLISIVSTHTGQVIATHHGLASTVGLAWSPDSKRIAAGFGDGKDVSQVWDALTGDNVVTHHGGGRTAWSPDGKYIASERSTDLTETVPNDEIQLWNPATGKTLYVYNSQVSYVDALVWSPDSKYIASVERNNSTSEVHVWVAVA